MKTNNPGEAYQEMQEALDRDEEPINIEELPNKDWLRQQ